MSTTTNSILNQPYKYEFKTNLNSYNIYGGLNILTINKIIEELKEPNFIKNFRLDSLKKLKTLKQPDWCFFEVPDINYDKLSYYSTPIKSNLNNNIKNELELTFEKLGISIEQQKKLTNTAIDFIFDSISISNIIEPFLSKTGIIFIPLFKAIKKYPYLIKKYLGTVVSNNDNFFSALNSVVFSEGSFCYIPKNIKCNFDLSTYFRMNSENFAQFERTLLIAGEYSKLTYLEGCTAPLYSESQLHVAIVEIIAKAFSSVKYSTVQNWYKGNEIGEGGLYNLTTKRGICFKNSSLEWTQIEVGSSITWKYPSTILKGNNSSSEFYSISLLSGVQEADTGTKMIHLGSNTKSKIISKSISLNSSINVYRGLVDISPNANKTFNHTECDSLLIGSKALTATFPYTKVSNSSAIIKQEASISKLDEEFLFLFMQRGINFKTAVTLLIYGFCYNICERLPLEFGVEIPLLISLRTEEALG
uniref:Cysteine desulfurase activator complex subunit SufB n=1 Tax=Nephromyces sp. ex Molgula occidentalis TaxID=2544991 RepID=A0A5C1H7W4_9APIC|nr:cysteine desulfurase activator complex subunit SufB [Nephromyces sp. ex Molgula occidentalis]